MSIVSLNYIEDPFYINEIAEYEITRFIPKHDGGEIGLLKRVKRR